MAVVVIDTIKPKNQGTFPVVEAADVKVTNDKRLDTALNEKANASTVEALSNAVAGKASQSDVTALQTAVAGKASQSDLTALSNTVADKADKSALAETNAAVASKQDTLSTAQLNAVNSGITSALVTQISTNTTAIAGKASQSALDATNATVANKANTSDVNTATTNLQSQIDNIVSGSTEDSEVINARVGADGTSYPTLKARIDSEVNGIDADLVPLIPLSDHAEPGVFVAQYEVGAIDGTGANINNSARIRTVTAYPISDITSISIDNDMEYYVMLYTSWTDVSNFTGLYRSDWFSTQTTIESLLQSYPTAQYIRWGAQYKTPEAISDVSAAASKLHVLGDVIVEGDFTKLKNKVDKNLGFIYITDDDTTLTNGYIKYADGDVGSVADSKYTDYISVKAYKQLYVSNVNTASADARGLAFYDCDKNYISGIQYSGSSDFTANVPETADFVRLTVAASLATSFFLRIDQKAFTTEVSSILSDIEKEYDTFKDDVDNNLGLIYLTASDTTFSSGYIKFADGTTQTLSGSEYTDYIPVKAYKQLYVSNVNTASADARGLAFYDSEKVYISGYQYDGSADFTVNVPENANFVRITVKTALKSSFYLKINQKDFTMKVSSVLSGGAESIELPFDNIIQNGGYMTLFHKLGCIGDSLASGETYYNNTGDGKYHALTPNYDISWGQNIARALGITAFNFSRGGQSAKTWFEEWSNNSSFVDNLCTAYVIALGVNDSNPNSSAYTPLGTSADIDLSDYTQNADSFYGNYAKIIQRIQELTPKAKIFIMTIPTGQNAEAGYNEAIRYMATIFDNVYLMDFRLYGGDIYRALCVEKSPYWFNGHGTALLYQISAWHILSYVDYIVRNNPLEFREVQFIGTDYAIVD